MREFSVVHISDLHITPDCTDKFDLLINGINTYTNDLPKHHPILLLVTGDTVESPSRKNVDKATELIGGEEILQRLRLSEEPIMIAGNHDTKGLGVFFRKKTFLKAFGSETTKKYDNNDLKLQIVGVDSTRGKLARGKISREDYRKIFSEYYEDGKGFLRLFALHHHPLPLVAGEDHKIFGFVNDERFMYLRSPAGFLQVVSECGSQIVLHGHRHVAGVVRYSLPKVKKNGEIQWSNIYVISCPSSTGHDSGNTGFNILSFYSIGQKQFVTICRYISTDKTRFERIEPKGIIIELDGNYSWDAFDDFKLKFKSFDGSKDYNQNDVNCLLKDIFKSNVFQIDPKRENWDEVLFSYKLVVDTMPIIKVDTGKKESFEQIRKCMNDIVQRLLDIFSISKDDFEKWRREYEEKKANPIPRKKLINPHLGTLQKGLLNLHEGLISYGIEVGAVGDYEDS